MRSSLQGDLLHSHVSCCPAMQWAAWVSLQVYKLLCVKIPVKRRIHQGLINHRCPKARENKKFSESVNSLATTICSAATRKIVCGWADIYRACVYPFFSPGALPTVDCPLHLKLSLLVPYSHWTGLLLCPAGHTVEVVLDTSQPVVKHI